MNQYPGGNIDPRLVAEPQNFDDADIQYFNNMMSDSDMGYTTTDSQFEGLSEMSADFVFQPQPQQPLPTPSDVPEESPAESYHPEFGWYNRSGPYGEGAHFNRAIGWYIPVLPPGRPTGRRPAMPSSAMGSGMNTPMMPPHPFAAPQAPMFAAPEPKTPTRPKTTKPKTPSTRRRQPKASAASKNGVTKTPSKPKPKSTPKKKLSLAEVCTCKPRAHKIGRPPNAFIIFRSKFSESVKRELNTNDNPTVSNELGRRWRALSPKSQAVFKGLAEQRKIQHERDHPDYKFQPVSKEAEKFGTRDCTCGAYEKNTRYRRQRDAEIAASESGMTDTDLVDEPDEMEEDFDMRAYETAAPEPLPRPTSSMKRKKSPEPIVTQLAAKRPQRQASRGVSYKEPGENDIPIVDSNGRKSHPSNGSSSFGVNLANMDFTDFDFAAFERELVAESNNAANMQSNYNADVQMNGDEDPGYQLDDDALNEELFGESPSRRSSRKSSGGTRKSSRLSAGSRASGKSSPTRRSARIARNE